MIIEWKWGHLAGDGRTFLIYLEAKQKQLAGTF
jgi:hypothetical protein